MLVEASTELRATPAAVWKLVSDPETVPAVVVGLSRWEAVGSPRRGLGARYRVRMVVGSAHVGGLVEVVEFDEDRFSGNGLYLFASVLDRFFALYASVNTFTRTVATVARREGVYRRFPARAGEQIVL